MPYHIIDALALVCAVVCARRLYTWCTRSSSLPLPPGPKGIPVVGNVLEMQDGEIWETARQWGEKYGPLVHVKALGTSYVFVNSYEMAIELFEKRGSIYSSRPMNTMMELERWDWLVSIMPYGDELRRSRQLLRRFLHPGVVGEFAEIQTQSTHRLLLRLLQRPDCFQELLRQSAGEAIIMLAYGHLPQEKDDPFIELADKGVLAAGETFELFLVNSFPLLQYLPSWFPGTGFKKIAEVGLKLSMDMYREPFKFAKEKIVEGTAAPSMTSRLLDAKMSGDAVINDESLIAKVTAVTYAAGADTTVSALFSFFLAMLLYPDVQKCAQDEIDRVVGKDILPSFEDRQNLPFVEAIVKETMRWQPVLALALTHTSVEDDEFNGYFIPSGTNMLPNVCLDRAMQRDPKMYPKPEQFIPERWLPKDGEEPPLDVHKMFFGFGRRLCPGRHFADNSMFIGAASILAAFNISKALDDNGIPITPKGEYTPHVIRHPKPFEYVLTPRSEKMETVIRQAVEMIY